MDQSFIGDYGIVFAVLLGGVIAFYVLKDKGKKAWSIGQAHVDSDGLEYITDKGKQQRIAQCEIRWANEKRKADEKRIAEEKSASDSKLVDLLHKPNKQAKQKVQLAVSAQKQVQKLITSLLQAGTRAPRQASPVKLVTTRAPSSCTVLNGTVTISVHFSGEEEGKGEGASAENTLTLQHYLDSLHVSSTNFLARDILESCLPNNATKTNSKMVPMATLKLQLEWLNKVHSLCDPLNDFSRDIVRIFESPLAAKDDKSPPNALIVGQAIVSMFQNACVSLGQLILAPHDEPEDLLGNIANIAATMDNSALPPLFADEPMEIPPVKQRTRVKNKLAINLYGMMREKLLTSSFFCGISTGCFVVLRAFFSRVMEDIVNATTGPSNLFVRTDCDLIQAFPFSSLDVLLAAAPALGQLLAQNITACNVLGVAISTSTGKSIDGVEIMDTFLLTDLFCITHALSLSPILSFDPSPAAEPWTKPMQSPDQHRLIHIRIEDINYIVKRVRLVSLEIFKHALKDKKDIIDFFNLLLTLSTKRTLGRSDDRFEIARGFEPEGRVLSRHFVYGTVDLVTQLFASKSIDLEKHRNQLSNVALVQPLAVGEECICKFDVFLLFSCILFISALDREALRQQYVIDSMRMLIQNTHVSAAQKEQLQGYLQAYHWSSSCQAARPHSIDVMGHVADMFCQYLLQLITSPTAGQCFQFIERSPHNLYMSLSFAWRSLSRIRQPEASQVAAAERVVYLSCTLLNRPDLLNDVKQQSHWVNILKYIGGSMTNVEDDEEFKDECLAATDIAATGHSTRQETTSVKWKRNSPLKQSSPQKSVYFGFSRGPYVGAIFDSERNVRDLPAALARLYISCQSVEDWDADRDTSFSKFGLRDSISDLLTACFDHPLHSVYDSLLTCRYILLETLFLSVLDHNTSNLTFFITTIEDATGPEYMKDHYYLVKFAKQGIRFLLKICGKKLISKKQNQMKLCNQVLQLYHISALISNSTVELGLSGMRHFIDHQVHQLTRIMAALEGEGILQVLVECCVEKGVRFHIEDDATGINDLVAARWQQEDARRVQQQEDLLADNDSDDPHFLMAEVQRALDNASFVSEYHDAVSNISMGVESVSTIPGYRFDKIARESREKGASRRMGVLKAWKQVAKCLKNENGDNNFHPNGSILIKYSEGDASRARAVISVNADTPYAFGLFFFDIWLPPDYPRIPPLCELLTTGGGSFMLSPNLYTCGKVCMSLLNTAKSSADIERWQPDKSTVAQVLLTIQTSLLGDSEPLTKAGKARGSSQSLAYNEQKHCETVRWGMIDALLYGKEHMGEEFGEFIECHFSRLRDQVRYIVRAWWLNDRKNERMERIFIALLHELRKLAPTAELN